MAEFYLLLERIASLVDLNNPHEREVDEILGIIRGDEQLRRAFFDKATVSWLDLLSDKGIFRRTPEPRDEGDGKISFPWWAEGEYLKRVAGAKPNEVLAIIRGIKTENPRVAGCCIECLLAMPPDVAIQGDRLVIGFLESQHKAIQFYDWFWVGGPAAKYMTMIAEVDFGKSLAIAYRLLEIRPTKEGWEKIQSRYHKHEYLELMRLVQKLWEINPAGTFGVMVQVLDHFLDQIKEDDSYLYQNGFKLSIDDLENPTGNAVHAQDIEVTLIQGICRAGRTVIDRRPDLIATMLDDLEKRDKPILWRIAMYLLRYVPTRQETDRINHILQQQRFMEGQTYWYEYRNLLRDKFGEIDESPKRVFLGRVESQGIENRADWADWFRKAKGRDGTDEDFAANEARIRARELYPLKDHFKVEFERYKKLGGVEDQDLAPEPMFRFESRMLDPRENAEFSEEEWVKWEPVDVVTLCGDPKKTWERKEQFHPVITYEHAQASVLEGVVKKRTADYLLIGAGNIAAMRPAFLAAYYRAVWETIRQGNAELNWDGLTVTCEKVIEDHQGDVTFQSALNGVCDVIKEMMDRDIIRNDLISKQIERFWRIVEPLTRYSYYPDTIVKPEEEKDPLNECINCVPGEALQLAIRLGVIQRNQNQETYEQSLRPRIQGVLQWILDNAKVAKIECVFGLWLPQLFYIEEQWMTDHLNDLFDNKNQRRWWAIWTTYIVWSRVSKKAFEILKDQVIYTAALEKIGEKPLFHSRQTYEEGVMKHLMIAYFNEWIGYDDPLLGLFFKKADGNLRWQAAEFLTTGFKSFREDTETEPEKRKNAIGRLRRYWIERLKTGKENREELMGFAQWAKDCPLDAGEMLGLLRKTLELTDGKVGEWGRGLPDCIEGICAIGKGRELLALDCLLLLAQNQDIVMNYSLVKDRLDAFFREVVDLPEGTADRATIWQKSMEFADRLGRMGKMDLRWVWEAMRAKQGG